MPLPPEPPVATQGIWLSHDEIAALPTSGNAWERLESQARQSAGFPLVSDQNQMNNVYVLAKALVYARTGNELLRSEVRAHCMAAIGTEVGGRTLALGRELAAYVIAADIVGLSANEDQKFRAWLRVCLSEELDGLTLRSTHERRPNNWGTHAAASRAAIAAYLGDRAELERTAAVLKGYLGDRRAYTGFSYGDLAWQADSLNPVGVNPKGATRDGHSIDGVLPDDQRRAGPFVWPPPQENYVYEALQGVVVAAVILSRAGFDVWNWENRAVLRAYQWLYTECAFPAANDDRWQLPIIDRVYGTRYWTGATVSPGKNMAWTDWTHG